jgi:RecB family exonuclease
MLEEESSVSGVEVHKISSLPRNMLSRIPESKSLKRVDQVALSEHFEGDYTRGVTRSLLNSVLELRLSYFDLPYLENLLSSRPNPEYGMLLKVFKKYETFLKTNGLSDDADFKRALVDVLSDPNHKYFVQRSVMPVDAVVIFAGFTEYTSADLMLMEAISKNAQDAYIVGPDLMVEELDYSRVLAEELKRIGFDIKRIESTKKDRTKLYELRSPSEEAYFISSSLGTLLGASPGTPGASPSAAATSGATAVYTPCDLDLYYSLFKYLMGDKVSVRSSVRLDRSKILSVLTGLIKTGTKSWTFRDMQRLMSYPHLWSNYNDVRLLMSYLKRKALFPTNRDYFAELEKKEKIRKGASQVVELLDKVSNIFPPKSKPLGYITAVTKLIDAIKLREKLGVSDKFELSTVENLLYRVVTALDQQKEIVIDEFLRKLTVHAEENYLLRGLPSFTGTTVAPTRLITSNTAQNVWFVGMNHELARSNPKEDIIINDGLILSLRGENFIKPTSRESKILEDKIIKDALPGANVTYVSNLGDPLDCLKTVEKEPAELTARVQTKSIEIPGCYAELANTQTVIMGYRSERVSPSSIERYIECPYRYFASNVLGVEMIEADEHVPPANVQGQIAHEVLQELLSPYLKGAKINVGGEIRKIIVEYENTFKLTRSPANKVWANNLTLIIEKILDGEKEFFQRFPFIELMQTEQKLECYVELRDGEILFSPKRQDSGAGAAAVVAPPSLNVGGVAASATSPMPVGTGKVTTFSARVDRIDVNKKDNTFYIIDYKKSSTPGKPQIDDGRSVQLLLYLTVSTLMFPELKPGAGCYINLSKAATKDNPKSWRIIVGGIDDEICSKRSKGERSTLTISADNFAADVAALLSKRVVGALKGITSGVFTIAPINDLGTSPDGEEGEGESSTEREICEDCDYKRCCGVKYWY